MAFPESEKFLRQTGPLSGALLDQCAKLDGPPAGFERVWAAFEPMAVMQKRGQILRPQTGEAWQFLCDEGAALGGTDWAPPPLAYFGAGLASSIMGAVVEKAAARGIPADAISLKVDNHYTLSGSITQGTMEGKGENPDLSVTIDDDSLSAPEKSALVLEAASGVLAGYLLKNKFISAFSLIANGAPVALDLPDWAQTIDAAALPTADLDPAGPGAIYVSKDFIRPDDPSFVAAGGSGHDIVQNRTITVSAVAKTAKDVIRIEAGIARPGASVYGFLGAPDGGSPKSGSGDAPSSACLIAAGIGFCYMTQLGRYAEARKRPVQDYRVIQAIDIPLPGSDGSQTPVIGTKLFLNLDEPDDAFARELAHSARRTCFLHSTLQASLRSKISAG